MTMNNRNPLNFMISFVAVEENKSRKRNSAQEDAITHIKGLLQHTQTYSYRSRRRHWHRCYYHCRRHCLSLCRCALKLNAVTVISYGETCSYSNGMWHVACAMTSLRFFFFEVPCSTAAATGVHTSYRLL